jgi:hypothetical protein
MISTDNILADYSIEQFLDRNTWTVRFRVYKQPMENNPNFEFPVFDTWLEATNCVDCLRALPKNYLQTTDGDWVEVENIDG